MSDCGVHFAPSHSLRGFILIGLLVIVDARSTYQGFNVTAFTNSTTSLVPSTTSSTTDNINPVSTSLLVSTPSQTESHSSSLLSSAVDGSPSVHSLINSVGGSTNPDGSSIRTENATSVTPITFSSSNTFTRINTEIHLNSSTLPPIDLKQTASSDLSLSSNTINNSAKNTTAPYTTISPSNTNINQTTTGRSSAPNTPVPQVTPSPVFNHTKFNPSGDIHGPQIDRAGQNRNNFSITSFAHDTNTLYQNQNPYNTTLFPYNIYPPNPSLESRCGSSWLSEKSHSSVVPPAASPCCLNCTLFGGDVQVFVWPTPRPTPLVNTVVDELGHTFISPSVYVAFNQLSATNLCGALGETYYSTTLAFASNGLFTSIAPVIGNDKAPAALKDQMADYIWTAFNPNDLLGNCTSITSNSGSVTFSYNPCSPMLSVPFSVFQIDNNWTTCLPGISAFYDPPRILTPVSGFFGNSPITDAPKSNPTHEPAKAGSVPTPVIARPTDSPQTSFHRSFELSADSPTASPLPILGEEPINAAPPAKFSEKPASPAPQPADGQDSPPQKQNPNPAPGSEHQPGSPSQDSPPQNQNLNPAPGSEHQPERPSQDSAPPQNQNPNPAPGSEHQPESPSQDSAPQNQNPNPAPGLEHQPERPSQDSAPPQNPNPNPESAPAQHLSPENSDHPNGEQPAPQPPAVETSGQQPSQIQQSNPDQQSPQTFPSAEANPNVNSGPSGSEPVQNPQNHRVPPGSTDSAPSQESPKNPVIPADSNFSPVDVPEHNSPNSQDSRPNAGAGEQPSPPNNPPSITIPLIAGSNNVGVQATQPVTNPDSIPQLADHGIKVVPNNAPLPTIGNSPASIDSSGNVLINGQTITPKAPAVTINHTPVALGDDGLIIGGASTVAINHPQTTPLVIGGSPVSVDSSGNVIINNQVIKPNAPPVVINSTPVHLNTAGLTVGSSSPVALDKIPHNTPLPVIGGLPASVDSSGNVVVGSQTITPNAPPVIIKNTPVRLGTVGLVVGSSSPVALDKIPHNTPLPVIGGLPASVDSSGNVVVGSQTITPNAPPVIIKNTPVHLGTAGLVVGSSSPVPIDKGPRTTPLAIIGGSPASVDTSGNIVVNNQIITPNAPPVTIDHTPVRLNTAGLVIGNAPPIVVNQNVPDAPLATIGGLPISMDKFGNIKVSGQVIHPGVPMTINKTPVVLGTAGLVFGGPSTVPISQSPHYLVGSQHLKPGGPPIVNSGTTYSLAPHATAVIINAATPVSAPKQILLPTLTIGNSAITPNSNSNYVVGGQTLAPNGPPLTVSGKTYSLASNAAAIIVDGVTTPISVPSQTPVLTMGSSLITANAKSEFVIADQTLAPAGTPVTVSGTTFSLAPHASAVIINGMTSTFITPPLPTVPSVITIGSLTITANKDSQFVLGGQTLAPAGAPVTISGTTLSLAPHGSAIIINGMTSTLVNPSSPTAAAVLTIGSSTITANMNSQFVIAGQTLTPGASAITIPATTMPGTTISGKPIPGIIIPASTISLDTSAGFVVVNGVTSTLAAASPLNNEPTITASATLDRHLGAIIAGGFGVTNIPAADQPSPSIFTIGDQTFTAAPSAFPVAGTMLFAGGPDITISGTTISLEPSGILHIGTSAIKIPAAPSTSVFTIGDQTFTAAPSAFSIAGTTISAGGPEITISGTPISLGPSGILHIGTSIIDLPLSTSAPTSIFTVGGQTFTAAPSAFSIDGTTLSAGGPEITISGTPISLGPSGILHIGTSTIDLPLSTPAPTSIFTVGGQTFTAAPSAFSIDGTTLSAGGPGITIFGTPISLEPNGSLRIGTSEIPIPTPTPTPEHTNEQQGFAGLGFFDSGVQGRKGWGAAVAAVVAAVVVLGIGKL